MPKTEAYFHSVGEKCGLEFRAAGAPTAPRSSAAWRRRDVIDARFLGVLASCLLLGTLAAAVLGLVNALAVQLVYGLTALLLAGLLFVAPTLIHRQLKRRAQPEEPRDSLGALGGAAALAFTGLGAFVLVSSLVNEDYVREVWKLLFPTLPVFAVLAGLGREGYRATLRWLDAESGD